MKIGTDAVLLATLPRLEQAGQVLEIGAGTGVVSLMLAQRLRAAEFTAVEIDEAAAAQCAENFDASPWPERLKAVHASFEDFHSSLLFDLIISNPPYFLNSLRSDDPQRNKARHAHEYLLQEWVQRSASLLSATGKVIFILPWDQLAIFRDAIKSAYLFEHEIIGISSFPGTEVIRFIGIASKTYLEPCSGHFYIYEKQGVHSEAYDNLLRDYFIIYK